MKKFFTLIALLAMTMGASAAGEWVQDYKIDYSSNTGFPFYVMGYVPEWFDGVMTDFGANYKYVAVEGAEETSDVIVKTQGGVEYYKIGPLDEPAWHQYFIADGIPTELDGAYTVKAMVKASEACTITVNMGWSWSEDPKSAQVAIGTDWEEIEWEYSGIGGASCNLVAQPGTTTATIEWKYVIVGHVQKEQRPVEWIEDLVNGDAEKSWAELGLADVAYNDMENNFKICAWGKEKGVNMDEAGEGWNPFPATIGEEEVTCAPGSPGGHDSLDLSIVVFFLAPRLLALCIYDLSNVILIAYEVIQDSCLAVIPGRILLKDLQGYQFLTFSRHNCNLFFVYYPLSCKYHAKLSTKTFFRPIYIR